MVTTACPTEVRAAHWPALIPESARELAFHRTHALYSWMVVPQIGSPSSGGGASGKVPVSVPHTLQGLHFHARFSFRDLATKAVGLGCKPGTARSDLQVHRNPSQPHSSEQAVMAVVASLLHQPYSGPKRSWPQHEPHTSQGYLAHARVKNTEVRLRHREGFTGTSAPWS